MDIQRDRFRSHDTFVRKELRADALSHPTAIVAITEIAGAIARPAMSVCNEVIK